MIGTHAPGHAPLGNTSRSGTPVKNGMDRQGNGVKRRVGPQNEGRRPRNGPSNEVPNCSHVLGRKLRSVKLAIIPKPDLKKDGTMNFGFKNCLKNHLVI